jgi:hypothetical protein
MNEIADDEKITLFPGGQKTVTHTAIFERSGFFYVNSAAPASIIALALFAIRYGIHGVARADRDEGRC